MWFRNYAPTLNQFLTRDMYNGALTDMTLTTDPFTGNRYTFAAGNPITNIELDGHMFPGSGGGTTTSTPSSSNAPAAQACSWIGEMRLNRCSGFSASPASPPGDSEIVADPCPGSLINVCGVNASWVRSAVRYGKQAGVDPSLVPGIAI